MFGTQPEDPLRSDKTLRNEYVQVRREVREYKRRRREYK